MRFLARLGFVFAICVAISACSSGPRMVKITGTLKTNDKPLKIDSNGSVTVIFSPIVEKDAHFTTYTGIYRTEDPTFVINEIPEGKYKVSLLCMVLEQTREIQDINEKFSAQNTPIVREVKGGIEPLVIDLAKP